MPSIEAAAVKARMHANDWVPRYQRQDVNLQICFLNECLSKIMSTFFVVFSSVVLSDGNGCTPDNSFNPSQN